MRCARRAAVLVATVAMAVTAYADRPGAEEFASQGAKALRARQWQVALDHYARAAEADPNWIPAVSGYGEALYGAGERGAGLEHLRRFVDAATADARTGHDFADELRRVRKLLGNRDKGGRKLERLIDGYVTSCAKLAGRWEQKDAAAARLAWKAGAALRPHDALLGHIAWRLGIRDDGEALFHGTDGSGWKWFETPNWSVRDGAIMGVGTDVYSVCRTNDRLSGNFDVRCEARVVKGSSAVFLLQGAWSTTHQNISLGMRGGQVLLMEGWELPRNADPPSAQPRETRGRIDPNAWSLFELRFRSDRILGVVNGEPVGSIRRSAASSGGYVALVCLAGSVAFRNIEVVRR